MTDLKENTVAAGWPGADPHDTAKPSPIRPAVAQCNSFGDYPRAKTMAVIWLERVGIDLSLVHGAA